jgi:hypothetical protein
MDPNRATLWAGRSLAVIGIGHMTLTLSPAVRSGAARRWLAGDLWSTDRPGSGRTELAFWRAPGSLGVPLAVAGALVVRLARAGVPVPRPVTGVLAAWGAFGAAVLEPSGYPLAVVPVGLLIAAERGRLRHDAGRGTRRPR